MAKTKQLKIGDLLYRCVDFGLGMQICKYEVYEVRQTADSILYAIECKACSSDHENCRILVSAREEGLDNHYRFVSMLNNNGYYEGEDGEEYSFRDDQTSYHETNDGCYYSTSKKEAARLWVAKLVDRKENRIEYFKNEIKRLEKEIQEAKSFHEALEEK